jgi:pimeloyl-ACP methyl ester carboxylesterase
MKTRMKWLIAVVAIAVVAIALAVALCSSDIGRGRFFRDQTYHFQTLRVLGDAPFDGADISETLETVKKIHGGDEQGWCAAWSATGDRVLALAESTRDPLTKGKAYLHAHTYYRTAEFLLPPADPKRKILTRKNVAAFHEGLKYLNVKYERMYAPYGQGYRLPMNFYPADAKIRRNTLLVFLGGYDSTLEELYFILVKDAHDHRYNVLTFDGPGQGSVLREQNLPFTPEWERPTSAVVDTFLKAHPRPEKMVLIGLSMGGYLAPRAAAFDNRFDGVVALDAVFDMGATASRYVPSFAFRLKARGMEGLVDTFASIKASSSPGVRWAMANGEWTLGKMHALDVVEEFKKYSLAGVAQRIKGDVLLFAGTEDHFIDIGQVKQMQDALTSARSVKTVIYDRQSGGAEHCQLGADTLWHAALFDWLAEKFN